MNSTPERLPVRLSTTAIPVGSAATGDATATAPARARVTSQARPMFPAEKRANAKVVVAMTGLPLSNLAPRDGVAVHDRVANVRWRHCDFLSGWLLLRERRTVVRRAVTDELLFSPVETVIRVAAGDKKQKSPADRPGLSTYRRPYVR